MQLKNLGRNQLIAGICGLIILITALSMFRISYNEDIISSYNANANPLPSRSKIGMLDSFWQKYTGGTRDTSATSRDAGNAQDTIASTYRFMFVADVILLIALGGVIYKFRQ